MKMIKYKYVLLFFGFSSGIFSQSVLTIDDAIKIGLEKNYSVLIVKNEKEIAKTQNNFGNAGMSPVVSLNANLNLANVNSHQEFNTGVVQDRNGALSNNTGASANVAWMVFDGLKMFAIKKRLNQNEQLSALELKQQMENTVYEIISAYYSIVKINELIIDIACGHFSEIQLYIFINDVNVFLNTNLTINLEIFIVLISSTMFYSTVHILAGNDDKIINIIYKKVMNEIMEE